MTPSGVAAGPGLTVAAVARRLGVAPSTLRTWDRRYGLGPSAHAPGAHRRYGAADLERLQVMQQLVRSGVSVADAAEQARRWSEPSGAVDGPELGQQGSVRQIRPRSTHQEADRLVRGLAASASAMDAAGSGELIRGCLAQRGAVWTWDEVLRPVLVGLGRTWERTGGGVEIEHLLSNVARAELTAYTGAAGVAEAPSVLCACAPDELHDLPMYALAAALAERGRGVLVLGARTPAAALSAAIRRTGPEAVVVWACLPVEGPDVALALPTIRPRPRLVLAGPGWPAESAVGHAAATDLPGAVTQVLRPA